MQHWQSSSSKNQPIPSTLPKSNDRSSLDDSTNQLEWMVDELMHRLHPSWRRILLEDSQSTMTGAEVARIILHKCGRMDVKVCLSQDNRNCYIPLLNWIGLSEDVAGSRSVIAVAIAAHEIGHALQPRVVEKIGNILRNSPIYYLPILGELLMLRARIIKAVKFNSSGQSKTQDSIFANKIKRFKQKLKCYLEVGKQHRSPLASVLVILKGVCILLIAAVRFLIHLAFVILFAIFLVVPFMILFIVLAICCALICRCLVFLTEIDASLSALRLLKQYKILDKHERKAARKFLLAAALTYLRSCNLDRLFA